MLIYKNKIFKYVLYIYKKILIFFAGRKPQDRSDIGFWSHSHLQYFCLRLVIGKYLCTICTTYYVLFAHKLMVIQYSPRGQTEAAEILTKNLFCSLSHVEPRPLHCTVHYGPYHTENRTAPFSQNIG